jgi:hypothetical protein
MHRSNATEHVFFDPPGRHDGWLIAISLALSLLLPVLLGADMFFRARRQHEPAAQWINRLDLSGPALWPAGTALRHPDLMISAVDERPGPSLAPMDTTVFWGTGSEAQTKGCGP